VTADPGEISAPAHLSPDDLDRLVRAMSEALFRIAYRILGNRADAEDAVQNAWVKVLRTWPRVGSPPTWEEQCRLMVKVAVNEALQLIRKPYRRRESLGTDGKEKPGISEPVEEHVQVRERLRLTWHAIAELPEGRREVMGLYAAGYEYGEIAEMLGKKVSTVRSHMSNAREDLCRVLPDTGEGRPQ
jgi:RNA polymerase sigma-70 factor (ECF subfamily)